MSGRREFLSWLFFAGFIALVCFGLTLQQDQWSKAATGIGMAKTAVVQSENGPRGPGQQLSVTTSASSTLTVPGGAYIAHIQAYDGNIRYRDDGTSPTTTTGMCIFAGGDKWYIGDLDAIELISETGTVEVNVLYYGR